MGKKNTAKKHKFKHVEAAAATRASEASTHATDLRGVSRSETSQPARPAVAGASGRDFSYVGTDLRRIGVMAGLLVALELALYYVLVYTPAGTAIYNLVKV